MGSNLPYTSKHHAKPNWNEANAPVGLLTAAISKASDRRAFVIARDSCPDQGGTTAFAIDRWFVLSRRSRTVAGSSVHIRHQAVDTTTGLTAHQGAPWLLTEPTELVCSKVCPGQRQSFDFKIRRSLTPLEASVLVAISVGAIDMNPITRRAKRWSRLALWGRQSPYGSAPSANPRVKGDVTTGTSAHHPI